MVNDRFELEGFLLIDKPRGWTSRQVVDCAVRLLRTRRIGHGGTLDPIATGLLVLCVGKATRLTQFLHLQAKEYRALFQLGVTSPTDDADGPIQQVADAPQPSRADIEDALQSFIGRILQRPPDFSAVKIGGVRAYELARRGESVAPQPRQVEIYSIEVERYEFPWLQLAIRCGAGTYVRAIGRDLGEKLGCGAVMHGLVRLRVGPFSLEDAIRPDKLDRQTAAERLLPLRAAVADFPQVSLPGRQLNALLAGQQVRVDLPADRPKFGEYLAVLDTSGCLAGIATLLPEGVLKPVVNLRTPDRP